MKKPTTEETPGQFVRVTEVQKILPVSRARIYQLVEDGGLPHYRIGKVIFFDLTEVESWIREHRKCNGGTVR
ncbi:MAG: helix-turn-helix domain-containing protein [candidate division NC10 bacterium]|nr:helix-turn-helix domain-containing protein [candidate division NC10 bacterium]